MPLDSYRIDPLDYEYAHSILYAKCMKPFGFVAPVVYQKEFLAPTENQNGASEFNLRLAKLYGYHTGPVKAGDAKPIHVPASLTADDRACSNKALQQIGFNQTLDQQIGALGLAADDATHADPKYKAAVARWRQCMLPLGVPDLPTDPQEMPSPSQAKKFFTGGYVPSSPEEIRQATFDAECRETTGYATTYYDTEVAKEFALMDQHAELLAQGLAMKNQVTARIQQILISNGR